MSNEMRWIPVTERLPGEDDRGMEVIVTIEDRGDAGDDEPLYDTMTQCFWDRIGYCDAEKDEDVGKLCFMIEDRDDWGEFSGYSELKGVIAWMPVPAPYIPKEEK